MHHKMNNLGKIKLHEIITIAIATLALLVSITVPIVQSVYKSSDLRAAVSINSVKYNKEEEVWVLTYDVTFLNIGDYAQIVRDSRISILEKNLTSTSSPGDQPFEPIIVKPGEIKGIKLIANFCRLQAITDKKDVEIFDTSTLIISFNVVDGNGDISYSGFKIDKIEGSYNTKSGESKGGYSASVKDMILNLRSNGDVSQHSLLATSVIRGCMLQKENTLLNIKKHKKNL